MFWILLETEEVPTSSSNLSHQSKGKRQNIKKFAFLDFSFSRLLSHELHFETILEKKLIFGVLHRFLPKTFFYISVYQTFLIHCSLANGYRYFSSNTSIVTKQVNHVAIVPNDFYLLLNIYQFVTI